MSEKPIRHSEKRIRHATGRDDINRRGGVSRRHLSKRSVDYDQLMPKLREDIAHAITEATVVRTQKEIWDRARAITEEGKILVEQIEGDITLLLDGEVREKLDSINEIVARLDTQNQELWWASVKHTYDAIEQTVAVLNLDADHPEQFSSIRQTAAEIQSVVAMLNSDPDAAGQYSSIRQTHEQITSIVAMLESDPDDPRQYSAIRQLVDEIDLRVKADEIITAINLSKEGVRIRGNRVEIDSDTIIAKGAIHAEALNIGRIPSSLPEGAHLFRFDKSLASTRGLRPLPGHVATLRPGEGRFGGAVAVEEGTTNLVPSNSLKFEGWTAYSGAQVTLTQNVEFPEIGRNDATRIRTTGGTNTLKYFRNIERSIADQAYTGSVYIKNIGSKPVRFRTQLGRIVTVNPGEWTRAIDSGIGNGTTNFQLRFEALNVDDDLDFIAWGPQTERKPFATSFVDGTRAEGRLEYDVILRNPHTGHLWMYAPYRIESVFHGGAAKDDSALFELIDEATGHNVRFRTYRNRPYIDPTVGSYTSHRHRDWIPEANTWYGVTWKLLPDNFIVEVRDISGNLIQTWDAPSAEFTNFRPTKLRLDVFGGAVVIDELLILPYAASEDEIRAWYELDAPFYDAAENVGLDTPEGHVIEIDHRGILMTPAGFPQRGAHLDGRKLGFWDIANVPAVGIGDVRAMAQQLGSQMEYGLLINQGEIRASQAVLEASLVDRSVTGPKIENGTITGVKIAPGGVTLLQLNEFLQIPDAGRLLVQRYRNTTATSWVGIGGSTWRRLASWSVSKRDATNGYLMEVCRVEVTLRTRSTSSSSQQTEARLLLDGSVVATFPGPLLDPYAETTLTANIVLNFRSLSEESHTFAVEMRARSDVAARIDARTVYQNEQLPIRWGRPIYTIDGGVTGGCFTGCEVMCESGCEVSCQSNCQSHCQTGCQVSCQSTCETTSQGGGGCLREGTPVTIWDPDLQVYREVPVEQLRPGMILPGYDPETDTLEHGELVELVDAKFSNRFLRIHTDVGPSVDVTYSQPFDALADLGEGWKWHKMAARFLRPGMKLARPFDEPGRRLATITQVEQRIEHQVHFWNPITSRRSYIAAGYADQAKLPALPY